MGLPFSRSSGAPGFKNAEGIWNSRWLGGLGVCLFLLGLVIYVRAGVKAGVDFDVFYYPAGARYAAGLSPYVRDGDPLQIAAAARGEAKPITLTFYGGSPTTCALFAPFTRFPQRPAKIAWLLLTMGCFTGGVWLALRVILPDWSRSSRLLLLGLTACAGSLRWNGGQAQIEPLVVGAFGILLYAEQRGKNGLALVGGALTFLKWNAFPPLFCLLLLRRRYRLLAGIVVLAVGIDVLAAARLGVRETYAGNLLALRSYAIPGTSNYPDAQERLSLMRGETHPIRLLPGIVNEFTVNSTGDFVHWVYLFSAFTPTMAMANGLALLGSGLAFAGLILLAWRAGTRRNDPEFVLRFFAASVCLSLLCISHLKYDMLMLVFPFFIALRQARTRLNPEIAVLLIVCFVPAYAMTGGVAMAWWLTHLALPSNRVWLVPLYSYLATLAFLAAYASAWRYATDTSS